MALGTKTLTGKAVSAEALRTVKATWANWKTNLRTKRARPQPMIVHFSNSKKIYRFNKLLTHSLNESKACVFYNKHKHHDHVALRHSGELLKKKSTGKWFSLPLPLSYR